MNYSFHPQARQELVEAINYYNECGSGLGYIFMEEVQASIDRIIRHPKAWSKLSKNTRRCLTRRFPYGVIYQEIDGDILIIAIMHSKRKPGYWEDRIAPDLQKK
jgi:plasmid stabilization system protein ParE